MKWNGKEILSNFIDFDSSKHKPFTLDNNKLSIVPDGSGIGWFSDSNGTFLYKDVTGNFMIETEVEIRRIDNMPKYPKAQFSSGGLLIRNPHSKKYNENWLMYNIGYQNSFFGREIKATREANGFRLDPTYFMGYKSLSTLYLIPTEGVTSTKIRIARVNNEIRCFHFCDEQWLEEVPTNQMEVMGNGVKYPVENFNDKKFRPNQLNLPDNVQVGIIANPGMNVKKPFLKYRDAYMLFSYVLIEKINGFEECI